MCGIVGYIGNKQCTNVLLHGLQKLEYRGYDSSGLAVLKEQEIIIRKFKGRLQVLQDDITSFPISSTLGIGHTRWATHGEPSDLNSHPHSNETSSITVVHNGIIENYLELREKLSKKGCHFSSQTDTEVLAHLLDQLYQGDIVDAVKKMTKIIKGSYALAILCKNDPDKIIGIRKNSPLIVGLGHGENFLASDIPAVLNYTRNVYLMENDEIAICTKDSVKIIDHSGSEKKIDIFEVTWNAEDAEKSGYEHFMLKEINEQPEGIRKTMLSRITEDKDYVSLDDIKITKEDLDRYAKIYIIACGTAYHAGLIGKYLIEKYARIPVECDIASEFRYRNPIIDKNTLLIVISQSGETADSLAALELAKQKGARVLAISNVQGSSIARGADDVMYTWAGPEIAVASTKAYTTQLICMYALSMHFGLLTGNLPKDKYIYLRDELFKTPKLVQEILTYAQALHDLAKRNKDITDAYFIGRGLDYYVCLEGSLKLKEISYIHSEAAAAGELKHGPIALIDKNTLVLSMLTQDDLFEKTLSNIKEVKSRGAYVVAFSKKTNSAIEAEVDEIFYMPDIADDLSPILSVAYLQLLSYYFAYEKKCDIDKPRNLAKSVTVE
jgi:glucosamine--fructose-6-phosphate aminotransferase (isomerizing)